MTFIKIVYCIWGILKILHRLLAVIAFAIAFPSHKEFEGFTEHACITHMVYLVFLFAFNLHWLWRWREKPIDFIALIRRKTVDVEDVVQF